MAMSRYWVRKLGSRNVPGYREACEFDFFRGEAGRQDRPDIFDDGSLPEQPMRKLKGFCDIGNTVLTKAKERWGAAKFQQGQTRIYISNELDLTAEPRPKRNVTTLSHKDFMQILEPAWMKGSSVSDIEAVLKQTCILIMTKRFMYWRPATESEVSVDRIDLPGSLLRESGGQKYMDYRKGNKNLPEEFVSHVKWEQAWMTSGMERGGKDMPPLPTETITHSLFNPSEANRVVEVHVPPQPVKSETIGFKRSLTTCAGSIDLDSPVHKSIKKNQ